MCRPSSPPAPLSQKYPSSTLSYTHCRSNKKESETKFTSPIGLKLEGILPSYTPQLRLRGFENDRIISATLIRHFVPHPGRMTHSSRSPPSRAYRLHDWFVPHQHAYTTTSLVPRLPKNWVTAMVRAPKAVDLVSSRPVSQGPPLNQS
jgi:hypothetical protein